MMASTIVNFIEEAEVLSQELSEIVSITMRMDKFFRESNFGMFTDQFGMQ
ncbi:MAG: hypothetical protein WA839_10715 [Flavobacteriaceae bacterium]